MLYLDGEQDKVVVFTEERVEACTRYHLRGATTETLASYWRGYCLLPEAAVVPSIPEHIDVSLGDMQPINRQRRLQHT